MNNSLKNILIIGGTGYLGSNLRKTITNYNVFFTSTSGKDNSIKLDFLNKNTYKNILNEVNYGCIVILASNLKGLGTVELKEEFIQVDTIGFSDFLQYIKDNNLTKKIIYTSSMTVYGTSNALPVKEDGLLNPLSTYGLSKILGEEILNFYCQTNEAKGVVLRIPGIYGGDRNSGFIYNTAKKCLNNEPVSINTSSLGYWETINIIDLCQYFVNFINEYKWENKFDTFNIGYGTKIDLIECANLIKETLNSTSQINVEGTKDYIDLYLDNSKIKKHININNNYLSSLKTYLKTINS